MDIRQTIEHIYRAYETRNLDKVLGTLPEDFCFEWPFEPRNLRFSGISRGKREFAAKLEDLAACFEFKGYRATNILVDGNKAAAQVQIELVSAKTGEHFFTTTAHFWTFEDGVPVRLIEYGDSALLAEQSS